MEEFHLEQSTIEELTQKVLLLKSLLMDNEKEVKEASKLRMENAKLRQRNLQLIRNSERQENNIASLIAQRTYLLQTEASLLNKANESHNSVGSQNNDQIEKLQNQIQQITSCLQQFQSIESKKMFDSVDSTDSGINQVDYLQKQAADYRSQIEKLRTQLAWYRNKTVELEETQQRYESRSFRMQNLDEKCNEALLSAISAIKKMKVDKMNKRSIADILFNVIDDFCHLCAVKLQVQHNFTLLKQKTTKLTKKLLNTTEKSTPLSATKRKYEHRVAAHRDGHLSESNLDNVLTPEVNHTTNPLEPIEFNISKEEEEQQPENITSTISPKTVSISVYDEKKSPFAKSKKHVHVVDNDDDNQGTFVTPTSRKKLTRRRCRFVNKSKRKIDLDDTTSLSDMSSDEQLESKEPAINLDSSSPLEHKSSQVKKWKKSNFIKFIPSKIIQPIEEISNSESVELPEIAESIVDAGENSDDEIKLVEFPRPSVSPPPSEKIQEQANSSLKIDETAESKEPDLFASSPEPSLLSSIDISFLYADDDDSSSSSSSSIFSSKKIKRIKLVKEKTPTKVVKTSADSTKLEDKLFLTCSPSVTESPTKGVSRKKVSLKKSPTSPEKVSSSSEQLVVKKENKFESPKIVEKVSKLKRKRQEKIEKLHPPALPLREICKKENLIETTTTTMQEESVKTSLEIEPIENYHDEKPIKMDTFEPFPSTATEQPQVSPPLQITALSAAQKVTQFAKKVKRLQKDNENPPSVVHSMIPPDISPQRQQTKPMKFNPPRKIPPRERPIVDMLTENLPYSVACSDKFNLFKRQLNSFDNLIKTNGQISEFSEILSTSTEPQPISNESIEEANSNQPIMTTPQSPTSHDEELLMDPFVFPSSPPPPTILPSKKTKIPKSRRNKDIQLTKSQVITILLNDLKARLFLPVAYVKTEGLFSHDLVQSFVRDCWLHSDYQNIFVELMKSLTKKQGDLIEELDGSHFYQQNPNEIPFISSKNLLGFVHFLENICQSYDEALLSLSSSSSFPLPPHPLVSFHQFIIKNVTNFKKIKAFDWLNLLRIHFSLLLKTTRLTQSFFFELLIFFSVHSLIILPILALATVSPNHLATILNHSHIVSMKLQAEEKRAPSENQKLYSHMKSIMGPFINLVIQLPDRSCLDKYLADFPSDEESVQRIALLSTTLPLHTILTGILQPSISCRINDILDLPLLEVKNICSLLRSLWLIFVWVIGKRGKQAAKPSKSIVAEFVGIYKRILETVESLMEPTSGGGQDVDNEDERKLILVKCITEFAQFEPDLAIKTLLPTDNQEKRQSLMMFYSTKDNILARITNIANLFSVESFSPNNPSLL